MRSSSADLGARRLPGLSLTTFPDDTSFPDEGRSTPAGISSSASTSSPGGNVRGAGGGQCGSAWAASYGANFWMRRFSSSAAYTFP